MSDRGAIDLKDLVSAAVAGLAEAPAFLRTGGGFTVGLVAQHPGYTGSSLDSNQLRVSASSTSRIQGAAVHAMTAKALPLLSESIKAWLVPAGDSSTRIDDSLASLLYLNVISIREVQLLKEAVALPHSDGVFSSAETMNGLKVALQEVSSPVATHLLQTLLVAAEALTSVPNSVQRVRPAAEMADPDVSWTELLNGCMGGAGVGAAIGGTTGLQGAVAGAIVGCAVGAAAAAGAHSMDR